MRYEERTWFAAGEDHTITAARKGRRKSPWSKAPMVDSITAARCWTAHKKATRLELIKQAAKAK